MTTSNKLASAALLGLMTAGLLAATPAFAEHHEKGSCKGTAGCKGKAAAEKSECKGKDKEASNCSGKAEGEKSSCKAKSGCTGKDAK